MKRAVVSVLLFGFWLLSGTVYAQSLKSESNTPSVAGKSVSQEVSKQVSGDAAKKKKADDNEILVDSVEKNFGGKVNNTGEETYNNQYGVITNMQIVDGKIVFDNERYILVYYDNFKVERGFDGITRCSMRIFVLNDLKERINNFGVKLKWPEISTNVQMDKVNPGVKTYTDIMLLGDGCLSMDKAPTIEVNRCRVKGMSEDKCADAIRWFRKNQ